MTGHRSDTRSGWGRPRAHRSYERGAGAAFDRVAYFSDAVFAIAMTLLIVSVELPELTGPPDELESFVDPFLEIGIVPQLLSFFLAFLLLGRYWMAHHAFFSALRRIDRRMISLNLVYLAFVAFLPFPTELLGKFGEYPMSVVLFAVTMGTISGMETVIFWYAHHAKLLERQMNEAVFRMGVVQSTTPVVLFALSIPLAFVSTVAAMLLWLAAIPIGMMVDRRFHRHAREHPEDFPQVDVG